MKNNLNSYKWHYVLLAIYLAFFALCIRLGAVTYDTNTDALITLTNTASGATNHQSITINGSARLYTNDVSSSPSTLIASTNDVGYAATNALIQFNTYKHTGVWYTEPVSTNQIRVRSHMNSNLTVSLSADLGTVEYTTNLWAPNRPVYVPPEQYPYQPGATQMWSLVVEALSGNYPTSVLSSTSPAFTNFVNLYQSQTLSNKMVWLLSANTLNATNGFLQGLSITNAEDVSGNFGMVTNGTFQNPTINQAESISGNLDNTTNGTAYSLVIVNADSISGIISAITNGLWYNATIDTATATNLSSPGGGSLSEKLGTGSLADGQFSVAFGWFAGAYGDRSTAVGAGAQATNESAAAFGYNAKAWTDGATALGTGSNAQGTNSLAAGPAAGAAGYRAIAIGASSQAGYEDSVAIGASVIADAEDQVKIGKSTHTIDIDGILTADISTNMTDHGVHAFGDTGGPYGAFRISRYDNSSLANGNNAAVDCAGAGFMKVSGMSAAFAINGMTNSVGGNLDGLTLLVVKNNSYTLTIANDSGVDPVAGNRIYTGTGADVTITNYPGWFRTTYDSGISRWLLLDHSN